MCGLWSVSVTLHVDETLSQECEGAAVKEEELLDDLFASYLNLRALSPPPLSAQ